MNPVRISSAVTTSKCAVQRAITGRLLLGALLAATMCLPVGAVAQAYAPPDQQPEAQGQRVDILEEIEQLKREIEDIRQQLARITAVQTAQGEQLLLHQQAQSSTAAPTPVAPQAPRPVPQRPAVAPAVAAGQGSGDTGSPTVFVFKDGTRTEARNFAIVGGTLWIYTDQDAKKYAVSYIDVGATTAANASRGNKFQMPESR
ncbi:MAG: hypothetical protein JO187_08630 [Acidobacteria bacterium]|nr:hypothetical protein [Acidobacteriota bacterium]